MHHVRVLPWIPIAATRFIETAILKPEFEVFEWGTGGSTVWFAERVKHIVSVEDQLDWQIAVQSKLNEHGVGHKCELLLKSHAEYVASIDGYGMFDIVFVDGLAKYRQQCMRRAKAHIRSGGYMILDNPDVCPPPKRLLRDWECYKFYGYVVRTRRVLKIDPKRGHCWIWRNVTEKNCLMW